MKITATGKKDGKTVKLVYEDGEFTFNGKHKTIYEQEIEWHRKVRHPVGGVYFPPNDSPLNLINVIENYFFDCNAIAEVSGVDIEPVEYVYGRTY